MPARHNSIRHLIFISPHMKAYVRKVFWHTIRTGSLSPEHGMENCSIHALYIHISKQSSWQVQCAAVALSNVSILMNGKYEKKHNGVFYLYICMPFIIMPSYTKNFGINEQIGSILIIFFILTT